MAPGLALDSGEFIPASELNRRIDMKPKKITQMKQAGEIRWYSQHPMEVLQKRIAVLEAQLASAVNRMDLARDLLTDGNPRPACNWGLLDTSDIRAKLASRQEPRCPYCDGTGDVHGIDGEWRGVCTCSADKP